MSVDFTALPCAGLDCFARTNADERGRCTKERHMCPYRAAKYGAEWLCRCCKTCESRCREQGAFLDMVRGKDGCD